MDFSKGILEQIKTEDCELNHHESKTITKENIVQILEEWYIRSTPKKQRTNTTFGISPEKYKEFVNNGYLIDGCFTQKGLDNFEEINPFILFEI